MTIKTRLAPLIGCIHDPKAQDPARQCECPKTSAELNRGLGTPLERQVGGSHYVDMKIQPVEFIHANNIGYFEANVIKYVSRWRKKNGLADLEKVKHYIELLIQLEEAS